ncbi:Internalin-A [Kordia antarctica]|uniref:Internalin-A n=1 Tax=Kordia antarctica TaxID=1218801 RepID=A0A7L4ZEH1_9FLAO|nr:hypothetical protein [Kordia antarctica]QHI35128.1 Internalin-A [Kordia antarctica]
MRKYLFVFLVFVSVISCEKDDNFIEPTTPETVEQPTPEPEPIPISDEEFALENFGNMVTSNFIGRIIDEAGLGIENVSITIGNSIATTNYLGVFAIDGASVFDKFAYVKAEKDGYIAGSRTVVPIPNSTNDIQITLLTKNIIGSVTSGSASSISLSNGSEVTFQGEFVTETGTAYTGQVDVVMHYLQPNNSDTFSQMPGSLFGKREDGSAAMMETYGMLGINLFSPSGEQLNINEEFPATLTFPVDTSTPNAPTEMPLWYFDEEEGFWKEQGIATKVGNEYIAEVAHFSWWNCDAPIIPVTICFGIDAAVTLSNNKLEIIRNTTNQVIYSGYSNEVGQECGQFPKDEIVTIHIYSECSNTIIHTQQVGPFSSDNSFVLNVPNLPSELVQTTITGTLNNCDDNPITNGYVLLYKEADTNFLNVEMAVITDGTLSYSKTYCALDNMYQMIVFDLTNTEESAPIDLAFVTTTTDIGIVSTCNDSGGGTYVGDVQLLSQQEVDNFGLFGYTAIEGNLIINEYTSQITSLQSLSSLTTITGLVYIHDNEVLSSLTGLDNLTTISGNLQIDRNNSLTDLTGLTNLTTVSGYVFIDENSSLSDLTGLNNLTEVSDYFKIEDNASLTSLAGLENLTTVSGDLNIKYNPALINLTGLNNLTTVSSNLYIQYNDALTSLTGLESLTTVSGVFEVFRNSALTNLTTMGNLVTINNLSILDNDLLTNLSGLENLTTVSNILNIYSNDALTSLTGLNNLTTVSGDFIMKDNTLLLSLAPLGNLTTVSGYLEINGCTSIPDLTGMVSLTTLNGLRIIRNQLLTDLTGLENITSITGLSITYNYTLTSLTGLTNITSIGSLRLETNALTSLTGLENLTTFSSINIKNNDSLTNLTGLDNLTTISNLLIIEDNYSLTSLTGLENLTTVVNDIRIGHDGFISRPNPSLSNFCALTNLFTNGNYDANLVNIQDNAYNPSAQDIINGNCSQ